MQYGTINDITNLKFYTDNGLEIPMQKRYTLQWDLIPGDFSSYYIQEQISGYFIGDVDLTDLKNIKIIPETLVAGIINSGKIMVRFASAAGTDKNGMTIFKYGDTITDVEYYNYIKKVIMNPKNKIVISINANNNTYTNSYKINDIFAMSGTIYEYTNYYNVDTIYTGNNIADDYEYYQVLRLNQIDFVQGQEKPYILEVFEKVLPNIGNFFPFVTYEGSYHQEKISEGFVAVNTLMVLEENKDDEGNIYYARPYITPDSEYYLLFKPTDEGELKMVKKGITYDIEYTDDISFDLSYIDPESTTVDPLYFTVAFQGNEQGAYQNYLGIYMKSKEKEDKLFYMGLISIKVQVEGEDERFRTLLTNFGIPDPVYYSNIFAEQDYAEQGKDYALINKKSKQLMLTYDSIFNYVGTYKALMNAVKFLGYYDLIFKEWYTVKTSNDTNVDIAVQVIDTSTGSFLKQKLADYGVSIEDFRNYNKINKLSMIYHINQEDNDNIEINDITSAHYDKNDKTIYIDKDPISGQPIKYQMPSEVPLTKPVYIYRNDEILVKLIAVKKWLEQHIIGVGAYIADITGEGIYFGYFKTQGYQTQHHLEDFSAEQYYTPDVKSIGTFKNSSTYIECTLTELNNAIRFEDYKNTKISEFVRYTKDFVMSSSDGVVADISTLIISNTLECPVLGDEYEFDLIHKTDTGTLYEWTNSDSSSQILFEQGEIKLLFENQIDASIMFDDLPYIVLENANIRTAYGQWRNSIKWMVRELIDLSTGNTMYSLKNQEASLIDGYVNYNKEYYILEKSLPDAYIKYTEQTNSGLPMFLIHGYNFMNAVIPDKQINNFNLSNGTYVLEILKGDMLFKEKSGCSVKVKFDDSAVQKSSHASGIFDKEQKIELEYIYKSDKVPFVSFDQKQIIQDVSQILDIKVHDINVFQQQIHNYYNTILKDILDFSRQDVLTGTAYKEAIDYMQNVLMQEQLEHLNIKKEQMEKIILYDKCIESITNNSKANKTIPVNVTRTGQYELIGRAYDKYNNIFVSKYDNTANVTAQPVKIDTFVYNANSDNDEAFYRFNQNGMQLNASMIQELIDKSDKYPVFPKNYLINDFDNNYIDHTVKFDNMSYCIDTPKNNDYVIFENCVERCQRAVSGYTTTSLKLYMFDENPNRNNLYNPEVKTCNIVIYDKIKMADASIIQCNITSKFYQDTRTDKDYNANSYITVDIINGTQSQCHKIKQYINNSSIYNTYILNTMEYDVSANFNIEIDYNSKITSFTDNFDSASHEYPIFNPEDVVKLRYYRPYNLYNTSKYDISTAYSTLSETAYRICKVYIVDSNSNETDMSLIDFGKYNKSLIKSYKYAINGLIDEQLLYNADNKCVITYANHYPVHYKTKVTGDGLEYNIKLGYNDYHILQDEFTYNHKHMAIGKYIDDTYGGRIADYDDDNLKNTWIDLSTALSDINNIDMYQYYEFPVSIQEGKMAIFKHIDTENVLIPGYHTEWKVSAYMIDDIENWDNYRNNETKKTLFRSVNNILTFNTEVVGPYDIQLTCIDRYGNKIINEGGGRLYVK